MWLAKDGNYRELKWWECLKELLLGDWTDDILCSFGMPVIKGSERYNCQVLCLNRKIVMIRAKMWLANDGNYRELRWFTAWKQKDQLEEFQLPSEISEALSQKTVPFGYGFMQFLDTAVAAEVCEELFTPIPPHTELALNGVEVFMNASGSHHQLRKLDLRMRAFIGATNTRGGVYMYSNHQGCDGGRLYYDGCACIVVNGEVVAQGSQFSIKDVEVVVAQIDLDAVASLRGSISSFQEQAGSKQHVSSVNVPYKLCKPFNLQMSLSSPQKLDEVDMGMTYNELSAYGRLRKIFRCGPVSMFKNLCFGWGSKLSPSEVADKVKHFFKYYSINRHKMTVLTPSYHAESYSPEDNRFDLRQFLYNSRWPYQFRKIDELVDELSVGKDATTPNGAGVVAAGSADPKAGL
ncbi:glutamine-dependent NAD(+) synthetase [Artemisia annua]|uniref:NAD(+) synthase (glutamine-hydrolyzing) n=1 Tax=Artemisia annua TaxID=35608 RepID=A0A2U1PSR0_ARTAN|nr:glutamine-dependent NAD(+) synthetase [Artemisia annua]